MSDRSQALDALIGAVVTIVLLFLPFSSVLGGAVAGYLQGGELRDGLRVGALAGFFATLPMLVMVAVMGTVVSFGAVGMGVPRIAAVGGAFVLFVVLFWLIYFVGLSAVGGAVGVAVKGDPAIDPQAGD